MGDGQSEVEAAKRRYSDNLNDVRAKLRRLPETSVLRQASTTFPPATKAQIAGLNRDNDLDYWPRGYLFVNSRAVDSLLAFEHDVNELAKRSELARDRIRRALESPALGRSQWYPHLFEFLINTRLLKAHPKACFEVPVGSGRNVDCRFESEGTPYHVEVTALTQSESDQLEYDQYLERHGAGDSRPHSSSWDALEVGDRVRVKVYDKICKDFDPSSRQMADEGINVLALGLPTNPASSIDAAAWADGEWALWGLTEDESYVPDSGGQHPIRDVEEWVDERASAFLISKGKLIREEFVARRDEILEAPRRLSAVLVFDGPTHFKTYRNKRAFQANKITEDQLEHIATALSANVVWWPNAQ